VEAQLTTPKVRIAWKGVVSAKLRAQLTTPEGEVSVKGLSQDDTGGGSAYNTEGEESVEGRRECKTKGPADNTRR